MRFFLILSWVALLFSTTTLTSKVSAHLLTPEQIIEFIYDMDENLFFPETPHALFHKIGNTELLIPSSEYDLHEEDIEKRGPYKDYRVDYDHHLGTFRFAASRGEIN